MPHDNVSLPCRARFCRALIGSCAAGPAPPPGTPIPAAPFLDSATQTQQVSMPSNSKAIYLNIIFKIFIAGFTIVCHEVFELLHNYWVYCTDAQEWHIVSLLADVTSPTTSVWRLIYVFWAQRSTARRANSTRCTETSAYSARTKYIIRHWISREGSLRHSSGWGTEAFPHQWHVLRTRALAQNEAFLNISLLAKYDHMVPIYQPPSHATYHFSNLYRQGQLRDFEPRPTHRGKFSKFPGQNYFLPLIARIDD